MCYQATLIIVVLFVIFNSALRCFLPFLPARGICDLPNLAEAAQPANFGYQVCLFNIITITSSVNLPLHCLHVPPHGTRIWERSRGAEGGLGESHADFYWPNHALVLSLLWWAKQSFYIGEEVSVTGILPTVPTWKWGRNCSALCFSCSLTPQPLLEYSSGCTHMWGRRKP